jgi:hypothetical protein
MTWEKIEIKKIEGTSITYPFYPHNKKCGYCEGTNDTSHTVFETTLKTGFKVITCPCCLYENIMAEPEVVDTIKNIGVWK